MRVLSAAMSVLILTVAVAPELSRYAAERRLYRATAVLRLFFARPHEIPNSAHALQWAASTAAEASAGLPGDWRPLNTAGSALLFARRPEAALEKYRQALALGERPEVDVNVGRVYATLGRAEQAMAALLRAGWISPSLFDGLPPPAKAALRSQLDDFERRLRNGTLAAPPPKP